MTTIKEKYQALKSYGINPKFIANQLNTNLLRRKSNSLYIAQTVIYVGNGYQRDSNVEKLINELFDKHCSISTLQNA